MASSSRKDPRGRYRSEESDYDKILIDAGMYEEGLSKTEKQHLIAMIKESKAQQEWEHSFRCAVDDDSPAHQDVLTADTQEVTATSSKSPSSMIHDEEVPMEGITTTLSEGSPSPDIFESSQNENTENRSSLQKNGNIVPPSDSEDEVEKQQNPAVSATFQSDSEDGNQEEGSDIIVLPSENPTKQEPSPVFDINEETFHSLKSTSDVVMSDSPIFDPEPTKPQQTKHYVHTVSHARTMDHKRVLNTNIFDCIIQDEPQPFYEILLKKRLRGNFRRCPFFRDASSNFKNSRNIIRSELKKNSFLMAQMLNLKNETDPNSYFKWAPPVHTCSDDRLETMDRYSIAEPEECIRLPWGQKPVVLDWKKRDEKPKKFFISNEPRPNTLSLTRSQQMINACSVKVKRLDENELPHTNSQVFENKQSEDNSAKRLARKFNFFDFVDDEEDDIKDDENSVEEADDEKDGDWIEAKPGKGKGKGRGGKTTGEGGGKGRGGAESKRGGGRGTRGRGNRGNRGRGGTTPLIGIPLQVRQKDKSLKDMDTPSHPALDMATNKNMAQCPICSEYFNGDDIEQHAADCNSYAGLDTEKSMPSCHRCNTVVPVGMMQQHTLICEQKHRSSQTQPSSSTPGKGKYIADEIVPVESDDLISDDEDEPIRPPSPKRKCSDRSENES